MKMMNKFCSLMLSAVLCAGMAAPAFAFEGEAAPVEQPVLPEVVEDIVTITDETSGALTPEGNLTLVDDYHTNYSDGSGQQFITLVSKSGNTFYLVIDRNAKGQQTVHFMNLVDEADLLALMEEDAADAYTAEKEAAAQAERDKLKAEEEAKKAAEEAAASTIISLRKPSTKCVRAAWWRLLPVVTRWIVKILLPASTWQNEPICWGPFVCPTTLSVPTLVRMLSATLFSCKSVTALRTSNLHGCSWARPKMALPSTSIS